jgi:hypothetical protein
MYSILCRGGNIMPYNTCGDREFCFRNNQESLSFGLNGYNFCGTQYGYSGHDGVLLMMIAMMIL